MTKYDHNWCKPDAEMKPIYCPIPLRVVIHHHDEWDDPVLDPETGEPTSETEHKTRDWDETRTVLHPSDADKKLAGFKPLYDNNPGLHEEGKHWERTGKIADADTYWFWEYVLVDNPPPPPRVFVTADLVEALEEEGLWEQAKAWIIEHGKLDLVYTTAEFDETNENFQAGKTALQTTLGWTDEEVEELLAKCVKEGT